MKNIVSSFSELKSKNDTSIQFESPRLRFIFELNAQFVSHFEALQFSQDKLVCCNLMVQRFQLHSAYPKWNTDRISFSIIKNSLHERMQILLIVMDCPSKSLPVLSMSNVQQSHVHVHGTTYQSHQTCLCHLSYQFHFIC